MSQDLWLIRRKDTNLFGLSSFTPPPASAEVNHEERLSPEKDIALATLDHVIQEAENDINNGNNSAEPPTEHHATSILDSVIKEAEADLESDLDLYESKVESDLEEAKDETLLEEEASASVSDDYSEPIKNDLKII